MPIREFIDSSGIRWVVWSTVPAFGSGLGSLEGGWLTFDSRVARRRLAPIPEGWGEASTSALERWCRTAVTVRRTPPEGFPAHDRDL
jgi:hypothetical protein